MYPSSFEESFALGGDGREDRHVKRLCYGSFTFVHLHQCKFVSFRSLFHFPKRKARKSLHLVQFVQIAIDLL